MSMRPGTFLHLTAVPHPVPHVAMSDAAYDQAAFVLLCGDEEPTAPVLCAEAFPERMPRTYILDRLKVLLAARAGRW